MEERLPIIPDGYTTVTPWIIVRGAADFLDFVKTVLGGVETGRVSNEDGTIGHAEMRIGDAVVMVFDSSEGWPNTPAYLRLYVEDGQATYDRMLEAGCEPVTEPTLLAWGDKVGRVADRWGNVWWLQEQVEQVDEEEAIRRWTEPSYREAMAYVQDSLKDEMARRGQKLMKSEQP
ncbi:VOC family protein [Glycomyces sp. L485]|uniref:VOC family protein n=1 Tax=Glycomyces sp. L485 TaxID=2909235 RepID=UPI001F4B3B82|nr:VOC family protein [Glycomyces sp. L485]MCH7231937.1 VOC family protein [Glycomyces sp. L485]